MKKILSHIIVIWIIIIIFNSILINLPTHIEASLNPNSESIQDAISDGVAWLAGQQNLDGSWGDNTVYKVATTGFVLTKLQEYAYELGVSPFEKEYKYRDNVIKGWKFIFNTDNNKKPNHIYKQPICPQSHGTKMDDPDTNSNGYGLSFKAYTYYSSYTTGICLMALESSGTPNRVNDGDIDFNGDKKADTFLEIAQDIVDWLAFAQGDYSGSEGGWYYDYINNTNSSADNSNSGYTVLGLAAGEEFGCTIPDWVKSELNVWITNIQDPVNDDLNGYDGGSYYSPGGGSANLLRTGNLIFQMTFCGDQPTTPRFEAAMDYIERHWHDNAYTSQSWGYDKNISDYQAMFCLMKGLEYSGIDYLDLDDDSYPEHNWYNEFASVLIAQQETNGSWPRSGYDPDKNYLSTTWALITLEKIIPPEKKPFERPPFADAGGPYFCYEGDTIKFDGSGSYDLDGDILEFRWDFNSDSLWDTYWSTDPNGTYRYGDNWMGMATLKVREIDTSNNYSSIARAMVTVYNSPPIVYTIPNITITEKKTITLFAKATDFGSDDLTFRWIFSYTNITNISNFYPNNPPKSDQYPSLEFNPIDINDSVNLNLSENGDYQVTVIVKDDDGGVGINYTVISVNITPEKEPPKKRT